MEAILDDVKKYDIAELRAELVKYGVNVGPIAPTSKFLFQKRLASAIFKLQGGVKEDIETEDSITSSETSDQPKVEKQFSDVFYAVCLPENVDPDETSEAQQLVFSDKDVALKTAKKYKGSRFKVFKSENEANVFSKLTAESAFQSPAKKQENSDNKDIPVSTEGCVYKALKPQEIAQLRKYIDVGDVKTFKEWVWNNPRFLVSSGDTPVIFQEGCRYTAMHVAALKNKSEICRVILDTLEDPQFVSQLYSQSKNTEDTLSSRIRFLVDLYLNMPDKGNCESPLHMACKFGHELVVQVLAAHPMTDRVLKNKWGDSPKDIICTRCSSASASTKERIEILLQGQCYVPLVRSDDNCTQPVIGQPWSPDVTKSPLDIPRVAWSPRDPSLSIKACAGPMSPASAGLFHKRWTTPPSQSPDKARKYFNTKRSDSEKGLERIGRQLAYEMDVPWMEYWDFLGTFLHLATTDGLDALEEYFRKRIWFMFVKQFQDKHGIQETPEDFSDVVTPVKAPQNSAIEPEKRLNDVLKPVVNCAKDGESDLNKSELISESKTEGVNDIVSPMTGLSQSFAQLKLLDESLSDKATINTIDKSLNSDYPDCSFVSGDAKESNVLEKGEVEGSAKNGNEDEVKDATVLRKDLNNAEKVLHGDHKPTGGSLENAISNDETEKDISEKVSDTVKEIDIDEQQQANGGVTQEKDQAESVDSENEHSKKGALLRLNSEGSDSTASYATAVEDGEDDDLSCLSEFSDCEDSAVCIRLKNKADLNKLTQKLSTNISNENKTIVKFLLRLKQFSVDSGLKVDIVSIPEMENVSTIMLLENIDVLSCDGNIGGVVDGEVVEIGTGPCGKVQEGEVVRAYLTRSVTLPKIGYIHGPQPTREDLDASRAIGNVLISPENHPNVFHWKIKLSRFLSDTNYRWQSPAKVKSKLRQASPRPSPMMKTSPIVPYGSPLRLSSASHNTVTSSIRTKLFQTIHE